MIRLTLKCLGTHYCEPPMRRPPYVGSDNGPEFICSARVDRRGRRQDRLHRARQYSARQRKYVVSVTAIVFTASAIDAL
jgi:hypothetical protein